MKAFNQINAPQMLDSRNNDIYETDNKYTRHFFNDSSKSVKCRVRFYFMKNTEND